VQPNNNLLIVPARYNGPPTSGNGGWTAGLIASFISGGIPEITLQKPPPLQTPLTVVPTPNGLRLVDEADAVIATARPRAEEIPAVEPVSAAEAIEAAAKYAGYVYHHFPTCFVCGPARDDGLDIFPGRLPGGRTAAVFKAPADTVEPTVWAALDCPGGWTVIEDDHPWVLGRFAADISKLPDPGDDCVVMGALVNRQGRKALVRTTLYGPAGEVLARAEATWIAIPV
jgi:hypothetical protein